MRLSPYILNARLKQLGGALLRFVVLVEILARHLLFGHIGELQDEIDDLVLIDRRTELGQRIWIVAIVIPVPFTGSRQLARAPDHRAADFLVGDRDLVLFADLG